MTSRDLGTYQMLWDCPACGTTKLLGLDHRHCPNCGSAQDPKQRYFPSDADKVAVADHRYTGRDKICPACDAPAARIAHNCANCGSPLDEGADVAVRRDQTASSSANFAADSARLAKTEHRETAKGQEAREVAAAPKKRGKGRFVLVAIVALLALVVVTFTWKKPVEVEVAGHAWSRTIAVESYQSVAESAWRDQVPALAREVSCHREQRSTRRVESGQSCHVRRQDLGDGTYREVEECSPTHREEPVYDQRCTFRVDRWIEVRRAEASGRSLEDAPRWPELRLARTGTCLGCEREGARSERYEVLVVAKPGAEPKRCELPEATWRTLKVGVRKGAKSRVIGGGLDCSSLER